MFILSVPLRATTKLIMRARAQVKDFSGQDFHAVDRTRLNPLVFGVALAAIEKFWPQWWRRLTDSAVWLWLPGLASIGYALYLSDADEITVTAAVWQFPLIAFGMAALLLCAVSSRLPFRRIAIPGAAFIASIAYSAYLIQKLVIHFVAEYCSIHQIAMTSAGALVAVQLCIYAVATVLFFAIERPFLQLRHRLTNRRADLRSRP